MYQEKKIAIIIPCYNVAKFIVKVIETLPDFVDFIVAVDDKCPNNSGKIVQEYFKDNTKVYIAFHKKNQGVGGAVMTGYQKALELGADILIKMDGDGQMDPKYLNSLVQPIASNKADYTKGNRFSNLKALKSMPKVRLFGNSVLSFMLKAASGYWDIMDPTNGYTALDKKAANKINFESIDKRYFFESDMLINLNINKAVVEDVPMPALYGDEDSSLNIMNIILKFPLKILNGFVKRIMLKYFIYSFNVTSLYIFFGVLLTSWGLFFGLYKWIIGLKLNLETPTGTVMLSVLPLILGFQLLLQAINFDINAVPKKK